MSFGPKNKNKEVLWVLNHCQWFEDTRLDGVFQENPNDWEGLKFYDEYRKTKKGGLAMIPLKV